MLKEKAKLYLELINARVTLAMIYQHNGSPDYCKDLKEKMYAKNDNAEKRLRLLNEHKKI